MLCIFTAEFSQANSEGHKGTGCHVRSTGEGVYQFPQQPGSPALGQCSLPVSQIPRLVGQRPRFENPVCQCEPNSYDRFTNKDQTSYAYAVCVCVVIIQSAGLNVDHPSPFGCLDSSSHKVAKN